MSTKYDIIGWNMWISTKCMAAEIIGSGHFSDCPDYRPWPISHKIEFLLNLLSIYPQSFINNVLSYPVHIHTHGRTEAATHNNPHSEMLFSIYQSTCLLKAFIIRLITSDAELNKVHKGKYLFLSALFANTRFIITSRSVHTNYVFGDHLIIEFEPTRTMAAVSCLALHNSHYPSFSPTVMDSIWDEVSRTSRCCKYLFRNISKGNLK